MSSKETRAFKCLQLVNHCSRYTPELPVNFYTLITIWKWLLAIKAQLGAGVSGENVQRDIGTKITVGYNLKDWLDWNIDLNSGMSMVGKNIYIRMYI